MAGKLEVWRQLFFFLWRNGLYSFSYFQLFILDGAQGGEKKAKGNQDGFRLYDRIDFLCFDILAGLIILIYAIHASNSIQEERTVTETSQLLQSGISMPTKTTLIRNP